MTATKPLILVVDDDVDFLELVEHLLHGAGYRVAACHEPGAAWDRLATEKPALVVTDLMMESLDAGFSFARKLKADPAFHDVPVVIVTAAGSRRGFDFRPQSSADLEAMGVEAFLEKPITPQRFVARIRELLETPRTRKDTP